MIVVTINFEGLAMNWYRAQEERERFTNWLNLKERLLAEVEFCEPVGLAQMMRLAQRVENREIIRNEANLKGYAGASNTTFPMRTITSRGLTAGAGENKKEGPSKQLFDAEFQARKEKGLCFHCNEKYSFDHKHKAKEQRELRMFVATTNDGEMEIIEEAESERKS
ncbi:retrotransposon protein [Cucumis melo var. makuwa]|uniref:Retrotransposon protein n=1 Tax=Cucumis melo var. makuwa TaxID=1194695 RepID=A0A5A7TGP8_CUCMM|nr:retrotransposon protein [Cucumis melo var. makuwa]TYK05647.1 retrotransposon protein [Cucumis melo var. makuwa]